jgi:hypothetical protein
MFGSINSNFLTLFSLMLSRVRRILHTRNLHIDNKLELLLGQTRMDIIRSQTPLTLFELHDAEYSTTAKTPEISADLVSIAGTNGTKSLLISEKCKSWLEQHRSSPNAVSTIEMIFQQIVFNQGTEKGLEFLRDIDFNSTIKIATILAIGSLLEGDLFQFSRYFTTLRRNFWPIPSRIFTYILAAHLELYLDACRSQDEGINKFTVEAIEIEKSLKWAMKYQQVQGTSWNIDQLSLITVALAQAKKYESSVFFYRKLLRKSAIPPRFVLDFMLYGQFLFLLKKDQKFNVPIRIGTQFRPYPLKYLEKQYRKFNLKPDPLILKTILKFLLWNDSKDLKRNFFKFCLVFYDSNSSTYNQLLSLEKPGKPPDEWWYFTNFLKVRKCSRLLYLHPFSKDLV